MDEAEDNMRYANSANELYKELSKDSSDIVYVEDTRHTEYYDENLDTWFCKFCEQQIVRMG
jgi:esterase/lipase